MISDILRYTHHVTGMAERQPAILIAIKNS